MTKKKRMVVVTTDKDRRGVFYGELFSFNEAKQTAKLKNAQMAIYWSAKTKGVIGLASIGPQEGSRISPPIPAITLNGVTSVMVTTDVAQKQWEAELWS